MSDFFHERLRLGELSMRERVSWACRGRDPRIRETARARKTELDAQDREYLASHDPDAAVDSIRRRVAEERGARARETQGRRRRLWAAPIIAAAVLAVVWIASFPLSDRAANAVRMKGARTDLLCFRNGPDGVEELKPGAIVYAGDRIQLAYAAGARRYGAILSVDGRGTVTLHFPSDAAQPMLLSGDGPVFLPYSYVIDDAPSFEEFRFFVSNAEFPLDAVYDFLRTRAPLPRGVSVTVFHLKKGIKK